VKGSTCRWPIVKRSLLQVLGTLSSLLLLAGSACAQGGPPFRTDDPETPGNKHLEVNFGFIGDGNPASGAYQAPDFDFNYGLGERLQLKYELPIAIEETEAQPAAFGHGPTSGQVIGGLGNSLLGIKWRFYEHREGDPRFNNRFGTGLSDVFGRFRKAKPAESAGALPGTGDAASRVNLSVSTYPQLFVDNPTRAVARGLIAPGPSFFLPLEINGRLGPLRVDGEVGYNFGNRNVPQSWSRGVLVGHEFTDSTEAYTELYDQQDANRLPSGRGVGQFATGYSKQRQLTLGLGGRQALNHRKTLSLLLMGGRSFQSVSSTNSQPSWIAYVGLQVLLGPKDRVTPQVQQKLPDESKK
jgi:hypothetical protein